MAPTEKSASKAFGGNLRKYEATSSALGGLNTSFNVFVPETSKPVPVLYYLAGLTCNEDTGAQKGGFLRDAAEHGIALVFPDTSPRGAGVEGEDADWDFGTGAGFYLNATAEKYSKHYNMARYITEELPSLLKQTDLPLDLSRSSIFGHSMGGHGALSLYLLNPALYRSASAFAPIAHPTIAPWGDKAFKGYLKGGVEEGNGLDTTEILLSGKVKDRKLAIKVDTGLDDQFYKQDQLHPEDLIEAAKKAGKSSEIDVQLRDGYDHSYWFISTFGPEHIAWHAKHLA